jgi:WD40 repeat protein
LCRHFPSPPPPPPPAPPAKLGTYAYRADGTQLWKHEAAPASKDNGVYWVAVSRDGKWAASGGGHHKVAPRTTDLGYLYAYEVANGTPKPLPLNAGNGGVNTVALSSDGSYLVAGGDAAYVFARHGTTFAAPVVLTDYLGPTDSVVSVAISDDGKWVVYGTSTNRVGLYATNGSAGPVWWQAPAGHYIKFVAMAADGSGFAVVSTNRANATPTNPVGCNAYFFKVNSSGSLAPVYTWPLTLNGANCTGTLSVAINANGSRVAAVGNVDNGSAPTSGAVFFFDAQSGALLWAHPQTTAHGPNSVSVDGSGYQVAVGDGFNTPGSFYLFDALGGKVPLPMQPTAVAWSIQVSADGTAIAAGSDDSKVYRFEGVAHVPAAPQGLHIVS